MVKNKTLKMSYAQYDTDIKLAWKVKIVGWPEGIPFVKPSELGSNDRVRRICSAVRSGQIRWVYMELEEIRELEADIERRREEGTLNPRKERADKGKRHKSSRRRRADEDEEDDEGNNEEDDDNEDEEPSAVSSVRPTSTSATSTSTASTSATSVPPTSVPPTTTTTAARTASTATAAARTASAATTTATTTTITISIRSAPLAPVSPRRNTRASSPLSSPIWTSPTSTSAPSPPLTSTCSRLA